LTNAIETGRIAHAYLLPAPGAQGRPVRQKSLQKR
jgi:DNA polymerase III gamma/tau subunit